MSRAADENQFLLDRDEQQPDHGPDPHDEQHDPGLPGNQHKNDHRPEPGPYGGTVPGGKTPY